MLNAIRQAARSLLGSPAFTSTAVATIAVAIGVNAAIFSILDAVVLTPLPYRAPKELVAVWELMESDPVRPTRASAGAFVAWRRHTKAFSKIAAFGGIRLTLTGHGDPVALDGSRVDDAYFDLLGIPPRLGRTFRRDDTLRGAAPVVLISESAWADRFGHDPGIVGR